MRCLRFTCESHSPRFFDVLRRDLAIQEEGDCLEHFYVLKILIGIILDSQKLKSILWSWKSRSQWKFQKDCLWRSIFHR